MNRTLDNDSNQNDRSLASNHGDDYFAELCALSTTDSLTPEESKRLELHLSTCPGCRKIKAKYEAVLATTLPAMAVDYEPAVYDHHTLDSWSLEQAEASLMARIDREKLAEDKDPEPQKTSSRWSLPIPYAGAAIFLVVSFGAGYYVGLRHGRSSFPMAAASSVSRPVTVSLPPDAPHALSPLAPEVREAAAPELSELRRQLQASLATVARLEAQKNTLESALAERNADLERASAERVDWERQLSLARSNAEDLQAKLNLLANRPLPDTAPAQTLQTEVGELNASLQEKTAALVRDNELLEHDRDIRDLIGARDLYIAEIYDVAKTGKTQKPFGRVFYTQGKSLVFYAYDLDEKPGLRLASTFQAWGQKGVDQQHAVNLGIFYQDDQNKKRWILKSNDSATLSQIDAVFVTVEPHGESAKPSGKPLLFTYLRLSPNHP